MMAAVAEGSSSSGDGNNNNNDTIADATAAAVAAAIAATPTTGSNNNNTDSNNGNNSESLGEIWFENMRNRDDNNSTPSSPTNSSEQDQEGGSSRSGTGDGISECSINDNNNNNEKTNKKKRQRQDVLDAGQDQQRKKKRKEHSHNHHYHKAGGGGNKNKSKNKKRSRSSRSGSVGYLSDDEDNGYAGGNDDSSGSDTRSNLAAVVQAATALLEQHKQIDQRDKEKKELLQEQADKDQAQADLNRASAAASAIRATQELQKNLKQGQAMADAPQTSRDKETANNEAQTPAMGTSRMNAPIPKANETEKATAVSKKISKKASATSSGSNKNYDNESLGETTAKRNNETKTSVNGSFGDGLPDGNRPPEIKRRKERNAREKERSGKITDQFQELKDILTAAGVVVPKGTKGAILGITNQYIRTLRANQEAKQRQVAVLQQQVQQIQQGAMGNNVRRALQAAAAKNDLPVPGLYPLPAASANIPIAPAVVPTMQQSSECPAGAVNTNNNGVSNSNDGSGKEMEFDPLTEVQDNDYPDIWNHASVGMALATLGGTFLDCNEVFCSLLFCSRQELRNLSIFHLLSNSKTQQDQQDPLMKSNLQVAFDQISQLLERINMQNSRFNSSDDGSSDNSNSGSQMSTDAMGTAKPLPPVILRGSVQGHHHLGLAVSVVEAENHEENDGNTSSNSESEVPRKPRQYFCVTLVQHPSIFGTSEEQQLHEGDLIIPATFETGKWQEQDQLQQQAFSPFGDDDGGKKSPSPSQLYAVG